jgi:Flp pilus assembly protein TadG
MTWSATGGGRRNRGESAVNRMMIKEGMSGVRRRLARLARDRRGVAAVEFAFIAPILLTLYLVTMEVAQGIETNKKVGRISSMVADLVTQQSEMNQDQLEAIMEIGAAIIQPYNRTLPKIVITGIDISDDPTPDVTVVWSRQLDDGAFTVPYVEGSETTVPDAIEISDTFLVRVTVELDYRPVITWTAEQKASLGLAGAFDRIQMRETYYLRPRMSAAIPCDDC